MVGGLVADSSHTNTFEARLTVSSVAYAFFGHADTHSIPLIQFDVIDVTKRTNTEERLPD
jgi:hypothetical protein